MVYEYRLADRAVIVSGAAATKGFQNPRIRGSRIILFSISII